MLISALVSVLAFADLDAVLAIEDRFERSEALVGWSQTAESMSPEDAFRAAESMAVVDGIVQACLRYELVLGSALNGYEPALEALPMAWDRFQFDTGRPYRMNDVVAMGVPRPFEASPIRSIWLGETQVGDDGEPDPEWKAMFDADQEARGGDWSQLSQDEILAIRTGDYERRAEAYARTEALDFQHARDLFHAFFVFQHGEWWGDYALAHELGVAYALASGTGRSLSLMAYDRMLLNAEYPQRFGTQFGRPMPLRDDTGIGPGLRGLFFPPSDD